jgi:hypothetical protein
MDCEARGEVVGLRLPVVVRVAVNVPRGELEALGVFVGGRDGTGVFEVVDVFVAVCVIGGVLVCCADLVDDGDGLGDRVAEEDRDAVRVAVAVELGAS